MVEEKYVRFKTAQLLRQRGFGPRTIKINDVDHLAAYCHAYTPEGKEVWGMWSDDFYPCPTRQTAIEWLLEEKHLFIGISIAKDAETGNLYFYASITDVDTGEVVHTIGAFCPGDAIEHALQYALKELC